MAPKPNRNTVLAHSKERRMENDTAPPHPLALVTAQSIDILLERLRSLESMGNETALNSGVATSSSDDSGKSGELWKLDTALKDLVMSEEISPVGDTNSIDTKNMDACEKWKAGFGFAFDHDAVPQIPSTKAEFLEAVKGEVDNLTFIENGLNAYHGAIVSGQHYAFSNDFLNHQASTTRNTLFQIDQISDHLFEIVKEVKAIHGDAQKVEAELKKVFSHTQPWVKRTRTLLVSAHVFYKINYVIGFEALSRGA